MGPGRGKGVLELTLEFWVALVAKTHLSLDKGSWLLRVVPWSISRGDWPIYAASVESYSKVILTSHVFRLSSSNLLQPYANLDYNDDVQK